MKKILGLILSLLIFSSVSLGHAQLDLDDFNPFDGDGGLGSGLGFGDNDGDGQTDIDTSIQNFLEGAGEDITTDLFGNTGIGPIPDGEFVLPCPEDFNVIGQNTSARQFILNILNFFLSFLGIIAVAALIYAGFLYVTDGGQGSNQEKAKKVVLYAIIGIILVLASFAIVNTVIRDAAVGGNDSTSDVNVTGQFGGDLSLIERCRAQNGRSQSLIVWNIDDTQPSVVKDLTNLTVVQPGESVTYAIDILEFPNADGELTTINPELILWNFGDGFVDSNGQLQFANTYFDEGQNVVVVVLIDDQQKKYVLTRRILVGNGVTARFSASEFFPESGDEVSFDGRASTALIGSIQEFEWTTEVVAGTGNCPSLDGNNPRISAQFFGEGLVCAVSLTVRTNYPEITDTFTEQIEVVANEDGSISETPEPNVILSTIEQDPYGEGDNALFLVRTWAEDLVDDPLEHFEFEVWENGQRLITQTTTFGSDPSNAGSGGSQQGTQGYNQTFSEMLLDLSAFPGPRNLIFRVTTRNTFGNEAFRDNPPIDVIIPIPTDIPQLNIDFTLPAQIPVGGTHIPEIFPVELLEPGIYNFEWRIGGNVVSTESNPELVFETQGTQSVSLHVFPVDPGFITFFPPLGWTVTKNIFVETFDSNLPYETLDFTLPPQLPIGSTYQPQVFPSEELDETTYDYEWFVDGVPVSTSRNPDLYFETNGLQSVRLDVRVAEGQSANFQPVNGLTVVKNIFIGEGNYDRLDFLSPPNIGIDQQFTITPTPTSLLDEDIYDFTWSIDGQTISNDKIPTLSIDTLGVHSIGLNVTLEQGANPTFEPVDGLTVNKNIVVGPDNVDIGDSNNQPPVIWNIPVTPGNAGDTSTVFALYPLTSDPDDDPLTHTWDFGDGTILNVKNAAHRFSQPGTYPVTLTVSDGQASTEQTINFIIVNIGDIIPESTVDVYVRDEDSDLDQYDIGIKNKEAYLVQLTELQKRLDALIRELDLLRAQKAEKEAEYERLNDETYVQSLVDQALEDSLLVQEKQAECDALDEGDAKDICLQQLANIKAQVEADVRERIKAQKEALLIEIFQIDSQITDKELALQDINAEISEIETLLTGGSFAIKGTTNTVFFLYGTLPPESARAILLEWDFGDGRKQLGQNASVQYPRPGLYDVEMIVTDGINTVSDFIKIRVDPVRPGVSTTQK